MRLAWTDMTKGDDPVAYGRASCKQCFDKGLVGHHFTKFHTWPLLLTSGVKFRKVVATKPLSNH